MNSVGVIITSLLAAVVLLAPRRWAVLGVVAAICYVTQGQQFVVGGFHFTAVRAVLLAGVLRCLLRGETRRVEINAVDKAFIAFALAQFFVYILRERTTDALVYRLGCAYDMVLPYFLFRSLIPGLEDTREYIRGLAFLLIPFAALMLWESMTAHNLFQSMGGQGWDEAYFREGRVRCVGSFRGPHSAGIFGATLAPLFIALWLGNGPRRAAAVGLLCAAIITITSNSSGPLTALLSGLIGIFFWRFRADMRTVRRGIVIGLVGCHLVMKAPVWFLMMKVSNIVGGDGWTRSYVIDQAVHRFSEWWLLGTSSTEGWMGQDMGGMDITNQFVGFGLSGGLLGLALFVLIFIRCFQNLGLACDASRNQSVETEMLFWCLGAALFAHLMAQLTVGYFDQITVAWWALVAVIASSTSDFLKNAAAAEPSSIVEEPVPINSEFSKVP